MIKDEFGQFVYNENDVFDAIMQGIDMLHAGNILLSQKTKSLETVSALKEYHKPDMSIEQFDKKNQENWFMPDRYKQMDIAKHILTLCNNEHELQRCGMELLLYQERELFNLLKFLVYLVDVMKENNIIWGVGRGSSVASYVLFKIEIHKVDSMFYKLDVREFLR